ncbi:MAG: hypothetical protein RLY86_940 [Pseudomonadota bacterium]|jgi:hypothetical protein
MGAGRVGTLLPLFAVLVAAVAFLFLSIDRVVNAQVDAAHRAVQRDLTALYDFAGAQSAAFAGTGFIGYSVGRYYGFAPAFTQISPDPERAAVMLRAAYGRNGGRATDLPPPLLAYDTVHGRFHPAFVAMIEASPFDDLFLVDRLGRVVYSLRKDGAFGADLRDPRYRDLPLAAAVRGVMARVQQEQDPDRILVATAPRMTEDGHAVMLARPIVRHGTVEGIAVFRLPARVIDQRLAALERPGLVMDLLDGDGMTVTDTAAPGSGAAAADAAPQGTQDRDTTHSGTPDRGTAVRGAVGGETGWTYQLRADRWVLAGGLIAGAWLLTAAALAAAVWTVLRPWPRTAPARPLAMMPPAGAVGFPVEGAVVPALPPGPGPDPAPAGAAEPAPAAAPLAAPSSRVTEPAPAPANPPDTGDAAEIPPPRAEEGEEAEPAADSGDTAGEMDADEGYRRALVDTMTLTLDYWQKCRGKGKIELAEDSGLWRVYMDRSSLQTRTLDKYLLVETLPRNPRWRDVVRTAEYVLRHCTAPGPDRDAVTTALSRLKQHLRQAERI